MSITNNQNKNKRKTAGDKNEIDEEAPIMQKKIEKRKKSDGKVVSDKNEKKRKGRCRLHFLLIDGDSAGVTTAPCAGICN